MIKRSIFLLITSLVLCPGVTAFTHQSQIRRSSVVSSRRSNNENNNVVTTLEMAADPDMKKETTWDRITGPKLFKTVTNWNGIHSVPLVPLRILTGLLMIHHGSEG